MMHTTLTRKTDLNKTIKDFRNVVGIYDFWGSLTESRAARKVLELADIKNHQYIIEVACGTGQLFEKIVNSNPDGYNIGIDLSPDMLQKARIRLHRNHLDNFDLQEVNVFDLKLEDNSFDILINNFMVDLMPEESFDRVAAVFHGLLKPGGIAVISTFSFGTKKIHRLWYHIAKSFPGMLTGCRPVTFREHLENAGFEILDDLQVSQNTFPSEVIKAKKMV